MELYEYWFAKLSGIRAGKKSFLRKQVSSARELYNMEETELAEMGLTDRELKVIQDGKNPEGLKRLSEEVFQHSERGIRLLVCTEPDYPPRLSVIPQPPYALFYKGEWTKKDSPAAAVVGARACSGYGRKYAMEYASALAEAGICVVSGMALGIDGAAHRGALKAGGYTAAVLGCGPDICYPKEHIGLYRDILEQGGVILSEYPPGVPPLPQNFPARNRIISALCDVLLVMEARLRSGALITADMALEQGKDVYALPGEAGSALSQGTNGLIAQGAGILLSPEKLLEEGFSYRDKLSSKADKEKIMLESQENMVYSCLRPKPKSLQQLMHETGLPVTQLMEILMKLELSGQMEEVSKNYYRKLE